MIREVYAVEVAGACNLEAICSWCPMHNRPRMRKRGLIDRDTIKRAQYWVQKCPPTEVLHLHNFGEPLLHPEFDEIALGFAELAPISMSTNGVLLDEAWADRLAKVPWAWISVSPWKSQAMAKAAKLLSDRDILVRFPAGVTHNWAGQAKEGDKKKIFKGCPFLEKQKVVIRWDGALTTCCITDREQDTIGHVNDEPDDISVRGYDLCETCHHKVGG